MKKNYLFIAVALCPLLFTSACGVKPNSVDAPQDGRTASQSSIARTDILSRHASDATNDIMIDVDQGPGTTANAPIITPKDTVFPRRYPTR